MVFFESAKIIFFFGFQCILSKLKFIMSVLHFARSFLYLCSEFLKLCLWAFSLYFQKKRKKN